VPKLLDKKSPIQGLLRLHSRYGPPDRSAAHRRPLSRGSNPCGYPHKPLVSYRINRQLSGWIPPPLMIRAFGAHCHERTHAPQKPPPSAFKGQTGPFRRAARLEGWFHSINRSARTSTETGIVIPNSFATFWLTVSSKRVGCMIGSSPGFAPRAILSRYRTTPWAASSKLSP
jgi:hypothetical protein